MSTITRDRKMVLEGRSTIKIAGHGCNLNSADHRHHPRDDWSSPWCRRESTRRRRHKYNVRPAVREDLTQYREAPRPESNTRIVGGVDTGGDLSDPGLQFVVCLRNCRLIARAGAGRTGCLASALPGRSNFRNNSNLEHVFCLAAARPLNRVWGRQTLKTILAPSSKE